ncbi:hypothetical protein [Methylorubrum populi]|uniref:hypothetical protein n=1 Tax=Methylorubrum populi TaxID=223967 RepID=UPI002F3603AA
MTRFPRYHQAENVVTNHVMVMLRMLYNASPKLLEGLLQALCADEVTVGPRFSQQVAGAHSVPDGLILQEPLGPSSSRQSWAPRPTQASCGGIAGPSWTASLAVRALTCCR